MGKIGIMHDTRYVESESTQNKSNLIWNFMDIKNLPGESPSYVGILVGGGNYNTWRGVYLIDVCFRDNTQLIFTIIALEPPTANIVKFGYYLQDDVFHLTVQSDAPYSAYSFHLLKKGWRVPGVVPAAVLRNQFIQPNDPIAEKIVEVLPRFSLLNNPYLDATRRYEMIYGVNNFYIGRWYQDDRWFQLCDIIPSGQISFSLNNVHAWSGYSGASFRCAAGCLNPNQTPYIDITRVSGPSSTYDNVIAFGYTITSLDPDAEKPEWHFKLYVRMPRYSTDTTITVLSSLNASIPAPLPQPRAAEPEGLVHVSYRILPDEDQVRKIVQEELAKINK